MNTTTRTYRPGPSMTHALRILAASGGEVQGKWNLARSVGPHGSNRYGDQIVMRCVRRGLIALEGDGWSRQGYRVRLTDSGRSYLASL